MMQSATTHDIECVFCGKISQLPLHQAGIPSVDDEVNRHPALGSQLFIECGLPINDNTAIYVPEEEVRNKHFTTLDYLDCQALSREKIKVAGATCDEKASYQQEAQYLVIPDDFDFDDIKAVMKLLSEAKKKHRSHSRTRTRDSLIHRRMDVGFESARDELVVCSSQQNEINRDQNRPPDSSTDHFRNSQGYSTAWLQDQWMPEVAENEGTHPPHTHENISHNDVDYMLHDLPSSFDRLTVTTSLTSKVESVRQAEVQFFQSEPLVKNLLREEIPRWEDYVNDMESLYQEPTGLTLHYMHKNDTYDQRPDPHGDLGQLVLESNQENASSVHTFTTMLLSPCNSTSLEIKAATNTQSDDDLVFEIIQDTKDVALDLGHYKSNFTVTPSRLRMIPTMTTTQESNCEMFSPQHSRKLVSTLSADNLAEETLKQFQMELIMPPMDPLYNSNEVNVNMAVSPTFCHSCGNAHQLSLSSAAIVCGTFSCSLFMIPDDAVAAFASASRQHISEVNEYSEIGLNSRNSTSPYEQCEAQSSYASNVEAPFYHHREFHEVWNNGSRASVGINSSLDSVKMTAVLSRMSTLNKMVDSPQQEYIPDSANKEEMDLEMLIQRLSSAAKAIQDLEETVKDAESPGRCYHHMASM